MNIRSTLALAALMAAGNAFAGDTAVKIVNNSNWEIHEMYLSPVDEDEWGPDQLGKDIIDSDGGRFTLYSIPCDKYDVKLVDEDGDECTVPGVPLCGAKDTWRISNEDLLSCQVMTDEDDDDDY